MWIDLSLPHPLLRFQKGDEEALCDRFSVRRQCFQWLRAWTWMDLGSHAASATMGHVTSYKQLCHGFFWIVFLNVKWLRRPFIRSIIETSRVTAIW